MDLIVEKQTVSKSKASDYMALKEIVWQRWEFDLIDLHVHTNQQHIWHKISHWSRPINSNLILTICIRKANNMAQNIVENCICVGGCWWIDGWFMFVYRQLEWRLLGVLEFQRPHHQTHPNQFINPFIVSLIWSRSTPALNTEHL